MITASLPLQPHRAAGCTFWMCHQKQMVGLWDWWQRNEVWDPFSTFSSGWWEAINRKEVGSCSLEDRSKRHWEIFRGQPKEYFIEGNQIKVCIWPSILDSFQRMVASLTLDSSVPWEQFLWSWQDSVGLSLRGFWHPLEDPSLPAARKGGGICIQEVLWLASSLKFRILYKIFGIYKGAGNFGFLWDKTPNTCKLFWLL